MIDKDFEEAIKKIIEYHNIIADHANEEKDLPKGLEDEVAQFLGNEFPRVFLKAPAIQATAFLDATTANMPMPFVCNIMTGIVIYYMSEKLKEEMGISSPLDFPNIWDKLKE